MLRREFLIKSLLCAGASLFAPALSDGKASPLSPEYGRILDQMTFDQSFKTPELKARIVHASWNIGERSIPLSGLQMKGSNDKIAFTLDAHGVSQNLTLSIREYRSENNGGIAYLVRINGKDVAFRNAAFGDKGVTTCFLDIPDRSNTQSALQVELVNLAHSPLLICGATLYADLEEYALREELIQPLTVYLTADLDPARINIWRKSWSDRRDVKIGLCYCTFPMAQMPPENQKRELERIIAFGKEYDIPIEVDPITWWGGTPSGCDGEGGYWTDVTYQQVTYSPSLRQYGISIPNQWSNTPWLTMGNERLNSFKEAGFQTFGYLLREAYRNFNGDFPIKRLVLDNEPTYWARGNPGGSPFSEWDTYDAIADFNPAMRQLAKERGINLDPRNGLTEPQKKFLRDVLTEYYHVTHAAIHKGLGDIPLSYYVYTHSFETVCNGIFRSIVQGVGEGVIKSSRLGVEGDIDVNGNFTQFRELGIPAAVNVEFGGRSDAGPVVQDAYAAGCDHVTLFNAEDASVENIRKSLESGWSNYPPVVWRETLYSPTLQHLLEMATVSNDIVLDHDKILGRELNKDNILLLRLNSQQTIGQPAFGDLALSYRARAFVFKQDNADGFLSVKVGTRQNELQEISRMYNNGGGILQADITNLVKGSTEIWVEFDFHPLGLTDWVNLFEFSLQKPWTVEHLIGRNRSYDARRLRVESSIVGWRADAEWYMGLAASIPPQRLSETDKRSLTKAKSLFQKGSYAKACRLAWDIVLRHSSQAQPPPPGWRMPALDREERGELAWVDKNSIGINPYKPGFQNRTIPISNETAISLAENDHPATQSQFKDLNTGDDIHVIIRNGIATNIKAHRAYSNGRIIAFTSVTPFELPTITLEGQPPRPFGQGAIKNEDGSRWSYSIGKPPLKVGEVVRVTWNPRTNRIHEIQKTVSN